ncbi:MAG: choice-of-anchor Q domain-containing protein [Bacteroidota bacterium]|nr:choice-of-anchor Q domain-containing protein [Bacteroidota bacterium]
MRQIEICFAFLLLIFGCPQLFAQTSVPAGYVSGRWDFAGSPYQVQGNIELHPDSSLLIDAGVEVLFMQSYRFRVYGSLQALGNADSLVIFDTGNTFYRWIGVEFRDTTGMAPDSSILQYCHFSSSTQDFGGALGVMGYDSLRLDHCVFEYNEGFKGGAVYIEYADPLLQNLTIRNNNSIDGGGVFLVGASPAILNCVISDNDSEWIAGGLFAKEYSSPLIENCLIENNTSVGSAGGLYFHDYCEPVIRNCTISNNYCQSTQVGSGGGMKINFYCYVKLENCVIQDNLSNSRGGGMTITSDVDMVNCLVSGNQALMSGGGINVDLSISYYRPTVNITNSTIIDNSCQVGAGINSERSDLTLINSIVYDNNSSPENYIDIDKTALFIEYSNIQDSTEIIVNDSCSLQFGAGVIDEDPEFFSSSDFRLSELSPCINAGTPDTTSLGIPPTDLDGFDRVYDGRIDMGCYENQYYVGEKEIVQKEAEILLYPNPAITFFWVKSSLSIQSIAVTNTQGVLVYKRDCQSNDGIQISVEDWPAGVYQLDCRLAGGGKQFVRLLVL